VVDASARAYLHAVNKALRLERALDAAETAEALPRVAEAPADRARAVEARGDGKEDAVGGPVRVADTEGTIRLIHLV
jgi:hypothetical protein